MVTFSNQVTKIYNCTDMLNHPTFVVLRDPAMFRAVRVDAGGYGVRWNDDLDLSEAELWLHGQTVQTEDEPEALHVQVKAQQSPRMVTLHSK